MVCNKSFAFMSTFREQRIKSPWEIVERTFAWLENFRRLTIDYEYHTDFAEPIVLLDFCEIMLNKKLFKISH